MNRKNDYAGAHLTANQNETTCKRVLNRATHKNSRQIIDAERYFTRRIFRVFDSVIIDCDTLQAAREEHTRYTRACTTERKYIEVA